ncbi:MAG: flagellar export protein FliJ [Terriglobia bacterium]
MKKFTFGLESVLDHRKLLEDNERQRMLKIQGAIAKAKEVKEKLQGESAECQKMLSQQGLGPVDIDHVRHLSHYLDKLEKDIIQLTHLISKLEEDKRIQVEKLLQAKKNREIIQKLREKKYSAYQKEAGEMEQKLLDELSVAQYELPQEQNLPAEASMPAPEAPKCRK